jgi:hypothetical protein
LTDLTELHVRQEIEVERLSAALAGEFGDISPDLIEDAVRAEFKRRSTASVTAFVPIFVARELRRQLRTAAD